MMGRRRPPRFSGGGVSDEELAALLLDDVGGAGMTWKLDPTSGTLYHVTEPSFSLKLAESAGLSVTSFGKAP